MILQISLEKMLYLRNFTKVTIELTNFSKKTHYLTNFKKLNLRQFSIDKIVCGKIFKNSEKKDQMATISSLFYLTNLFLLTFKYIS